MKTKIEKYKTRYWALKTQDGELLAVTVYRKGAVALSQILENFPSRSEQPIPNE